jgi:hypothetical protein
MIENAALFDFSLTEANMAALDGLDRKLRFNDPGTYGKLYIFD